MTEPHRLHSMSGPVLAALRRKKGLTQAELARAAGVSRHTVSRCEQSALVNPWGIGPRRLLEALGIEIVPHSRTSTRARGDGALLPWLDWSVQDAIAREMARLAAKKQQAQARRRVLCGARTRKGQPCRHMSEPGRMRCKFHGGKSTGPRTAEGRARIAEAQRRRWERYRLDRGNNSST